MKKWEEDVEKKVEIVVKKVEVKCLVEEEERELEKVLKKLDKKVSCVLVLVLKVMEVELIRRCEEE